MLNGHTLNVLTFVRREAPEVGVRVVGMAGLAGISNAAVLGLINVGAASAAADDVNARVFLMFVTAIALFIVTKKYIMSVSIRLAEQIINRIRVRLADKVRHADLMRLEAVGRGTIYSRITTETSTISQAAPMLIDACQSAIMIVFCLAYIAWLSLPAAITTIAMVGAAVIYYLGEKRQIRAALARSAAQEVELFDGLTHVLSGFKELKLNRAKSDDVFRTVEATSDETRDLKIETGMKFVNAYIFSQTFFYILLGALVFVLPRYIETYSNQVIGITSAILFIMGPLSGVVSSLQLFATANVAVENIYGLEKALTEMASPPVSGTPPGRFSEIRIEGAGFAYQDAEGRELFRLGPVDLAIQPGEIVFLVGGNGSGKTSFLLLLTGLVPPDRGRITLDGNPVGGVELARYRELFSPIYSDYHLFDRLYGLPDIDEGRVRALLTEMGLERKTEYVDGRFTRQELSAGQKKRLALIVAILEDRPIVVFDEWAADQDPAFRRKFYEEILPDFRRRGKTVIAATHDDRYFHAADRVVALEYGAIRRDGAA